jgi:hypothetical protein
MDWMTHSLLSLLVAICSRSMRAGPINFQRSGSLSLVLLCDISITRTGTGTHWISPCSCRSDRLQVLQVTRRLPFVVTQRHIKPSPGQSESSCSAVSYYVQHIYLVEYIHPSIDPNPNPAADDDREGPTTKQGLQCRW